MKILMLSPYISEVYGGTSKIVKETVKALGNFEISLDLVTTNAGQANSSSLPLNTWIKNENYRTRYFPSWYKNDLVFSFSLLVWLYRNISNYNVVHTSTIFCPLLSIAHWLCQVHKIPYISTPHGMLEPWALSNKPTKKKLYLNFIEKQALRKAITIQATATVEGRNIKALQLNNQIVIVPNGIFAKEYESLPSPEIFYQQFPQTRDKLLILFLGRIDPKKGLDLLASAFSHIYPQYHNTHVVVAGADSISFLPTAKNYFAQASCLDAVTFTGMLTGEMKKAALAAASIYIAPSYSEGFSMSILEGMASGLPCIFTTGCNFPEAAKAEVAKVTDINSFAIAEALDWCLSYPEAAQEMGDRARNFIYNNYTWEITASKLREIYKAIDEGKPIPYLLNPF